MQCALGISIDVGFQKGPRDLFLVWYRQEDEDPVIGVKLTASSNSVASDSGIAEHAASRSSPFAAITIRSRAR